MCARARVGMCVPFVCVFAWVSVVCVFLCSQVEHRHQDQRECKHKRGCKRERA